MVVAERDGGLVGTEPLFLSHLRSGSMALAADQSVDWIVHDDHRRRGLFTRMTGQRLAACADGDPLKAPTNVHPGLFRGPVLRGHGAPALARCRRQRYVRERPQWRSPYDPWQVVGLDSTDPDS